LQRMDEHALAGEADLTIRGHESSLDLAAGPESVVHGAPGACRVGAIEGGAVLADDEGWCGAGEGQVDGAFWVAGRLHGVSGAVLGKLHNHGVGDEAVLVLGEIPVLQRIRVPERRGGAIQVVDPRVELAGGRNAKVAVYDLNEAEGASVAVDIEGLGLDTGGLGGEPLVALLG
jgi:hypothetical protein